MALLSNVVDHQLPMPLPGMRDGKTNRQRPMRVRWMIRNQTEGVLSREDVATLIRKALPKERYARTLIPTQADVMFYATNDPDMTARWYEQALQLVVSFNPSDPAHVAELALVVDMTTANRV